MTPRNKTIILWLVFLLGLLFHTDLGLMPLFHGLSVTASPAQSMADIAPVMWLMLGFFVPPIAAIIATSFTNSQSYRKFHFGFTILYTVLNFAHLIADLMVQPIIWYQIALLDSGKFMDGREGNDYAAKVSLSGLGKGSSLAARNLGKSRLVARQLYFDGLLDSQSLAKIDLRVLVAPHFKIDRPLGGL